MTLTKETIFGDIQGVLTSQGMASRVRDIDAELIAVMTDITSRIDLLETEAAISTTDGMAYVTEPSNLKAIRQIMLTGEDPLDLGTMDDYLATIAGETTPSEGTPTKYARHNGKIYLYDPIPDATYTGTVYGVLLHAAATTTITLPDRCRRALYYGVLRELWGGVLRPPINDENYDRLVVRCQAEQAVWENKYLAEIDILQLATPRPVGRVTYRDV